jgi:flagellar biosynthetic protein FliR
MLALQFGFGSLEAEFWRLIFVMTRIGAALVAAPLFGMAGVSTEARVIATGALAVLVCAWTPVVAPPDLLTLAGLLATAQEALLGLVLGFVLQLSFAAPTLAAEQIGGGMGMSLAASIDPATGSTSPVLGHFFGVMLTVIFLGLGAHLNWIALIVESYRTFPPGGGWFGPARIDELLHFASTMFATAVMIALPVTLVLLLVQVATGVISRSAPSLNLFSLGLPLGVFAGLTTLIMAAPLIADRMGSLSLEAVEQAGSLVRP